LIDALTAAFLWESTVREIGNLLIALHEGAGFLMKTTPESNFSNWARILAVRFIRKSFIPVWFSSKNMQLQAMPISRTVDSDKKAAVRASIKLDAGMGTFPIASLDLDTFLK